MSWESEYRHLQSSIYTSRLKVPRHLGVHDNLKTFTKYSERPVHSQSDLPQFDAIIKYKSSQRRSKTLGSAEFVYYIIYELRYLQSFVFFFNPIVGA